MTKIFRIENKYTKVDAVNLMQDLSKEGWTVLSLSLVINGSSIICNEKYVILFEREYKQE